MNPAIPPFPADDSPAARLALILERLHQALGRHAEAQRLAGQGAIIGPLLILIWRRVRRIGLRFAARAAREAAALSPLPSHPRTVSKTVIAGETWQSRGRPKPTPPDPLPRRKAWLLRLVPETAPITAQLRCFMADPDVAALLAAAPRLRGILNPLCHMLGIRAAGIRPAKALPQPAIMNPPPDAPPIPGHAPRQAAPPPVAVLPCAIPPSSSAGPPSEFSRALA